MNKKDLFTIKLVDFGLSGQLDLSISNSWVKKRCGTRLFMAPELIIDK